MKLLIATVLLALPMAAAAQGAGELWEITMNMPGMPAGMMPAQRVCGGDDPERSAKQDPSKKDCKVTDRKQSANRLTITMVCKDGTMTIDQQYNAARTEFKSTMSMKGGRQGDMEMTMNGRKIGACDAVAERKARDEKMDAQKKQMEAAMASGAAAMKEAADKQIKTCAAAVDKMDWRDLGMHGHCYAKKSDAQCKQTLDSYDKMSPELNKRCNASAAEFCKRFQTVDGFMKTQGREAQAQACGVSVASIKAANCPKALQAGQLAFLGGYCPVEAKPLAMEHCGGRDYTSRSGGKYNAFCTNYLANADFERPPGAKPAAKSSSSNTTTDAVNQGINKLKGLFGR